MVGAATTMYYYIIIFLVRKKLCKIYNNFYYHLLLFALGRLALAAPLAVPLDADRIDCRQWLPPRSH